MTLLYSGPSTIAGAGNGAFAAKNIENDTVVTMFRVAVLRKCRARQLLFDACVHDCKEGVVYHDAHWSPRSARHRALLSVRQCPGRMGRSAPASCALALARAVELLHHYTTFLLYKSTLPPPCCDGCVMRPARAARVCCVL